MKILILFLSLCLYGCGPTTVKYQDTGEKISGYNIKIMNFEGCEYLYVDAGHSTWGSHKGNCKNPIHQKHEDNIP